MLRNDIELLSGRITSGNITPSIFLLFKESPYMNILCEDLNIKEELDADTCRTATTTEETTGRVSYKEWIANNGELVSL